MHTPIINALNKYNDRETLRFHMPGHKGKTGFPLDVTELPDTDNLSAPEGAIAEALSLASVAFGSRQTYFLTGGSTSGNLAMLTSVAADGDTVIIDRACHISVFSALTLCGATPIYMHPDYKHGIAMPPSPQKVQAALSQNPTAKCVFITSPNAFGFTADVKAIADICHTFGVPLLVDEAHGAHFAFSPLLPPTAMESGADMCVQSAHKTLPALTGSAMLHLSNLKYASRLADAVHLYQSTSPSYLLMASIDYARAFMQEEGEEKLAQLIEWINKYKTPNVLDTDDITKIVVDCPGFSHKKIVPESTSPQNTVFISTVCDSEQDIKELFEATNELPAAFLSFITPPAAETVISPKAAYLLTGATICLDDAEGRVSKKSVYCYPPAVPIIAPGEIITHEAIDYIHTMQAQGCEVHGIQNGNINIII